MPFNGSGTFTVYTPGNPIANGDTSNAVYFNNTMTDFATGLSNTMTKDGQGVPTANIPMGNNKLTGLANGTISTDAAAYGQVTAAITTAAAAAQNGSQTYLTSVSGTNTITATLTGLTAYTAGLTVRFTAAGANTGAVTLNIGSLGAINLVRADGVALVTGDILSSGTYQAVYDGTSFKLQGSVSASQVSTSKQIQPILATVASNALTITLNPTSLDFRSTTLTTGVPLTRTVGSAITLVTPTSGATFGSTNGVAMRLAVIAIDNAGTVELAAVNTAGSNDLTESGLISTTAISGASTSASVFYSTTARASVAYRVVGYIDITEATAGTYATAPTLVQGIGGSVKAGFAVVNQSMVRLNTANGYGSTNNKIRRFTNVVVNQGTDITYADSATLGASFTINTNGVYALQYNDQFTTNTEVGWSLNSTQLSTSILSITQADILCINDSQSANNMGCASVTVYLAVGSVVRCHTSGSATGVNTGGCQVTVVRVA
jgi:hypothetical protein